MRAWQVVEHGEPRDALRKITEMDLPEPAPGLVRARVECAGIGLPDVLMCRGGSAYALTPPLPFIPGQEVVGEVTAVGEGAVARVGDRVMGVTSFMTGHGGFADECLLIDAFALPVPDEMPGTEAAGFSIPFLTAWVGLVQRARISAGETLLVLGGAGGTGSAAISLGCALGARVIATASGEERVGFCRELGAQSVIDRRIGPIDVRVRELTGGAGVNVVFDTVGGDAFAAATRCIAHEGRILVVGYASGQWGELRMPHLVSHGYSVMGVMPSGYDRAFRLDAQGEGTRLWQEGRFRVPIGRVAAFDELPSVLASLAKGDILGKAVIEMGRLSTLPGRPASD